jgi:hypothetical protein
LILRLLRFDALVIIPFMLVALFLVMATEGQLLLLRAYLHQQWPCGAWPLSQRLAVDATVMHVEVQCILQTGWETGTTEQSWRRCCKQ